MSDTLRIGSLIGTILVVAIHYNSKALISTEEGYNFNYYIQEFITGGLVRIAVPYFALLSGYFASLSWQKGKGYVGFIRKKTETLLVPYFIAAYTIFYMSCLVESLLRDASALSFSQIISYSKGIWTHPSEQLWYLRDLIILTAIAPILVSTPRIFRYILTMILGLLWLLEIQIFPIIQGWYLLNMETLFFFSLGGIVSAMDTAFLKTFLGRKKLIFFVILWSCLVFLRIWIKPDFFIWYSDRYTPFSLILYKVAILVGIPMLISLSYRFREREHLVFLSGLNFFVYLYHFFPLFYFRRLTERFIPGDISFYFDFPLATFITYGVGFCLYYYCPRGFGVITGSRNPHRRSKYAAE